LAPDVEMKICFPKPKNGSQSAAIAHSETSDIQKPDHDIFYYKNNQLMPAQNDNHAANMMPYDAKRYYNHRRSLSLARIDSGMSGELILLIELD
jgi:hypothetical protein